MAYGAVQLVGQGSVFIRSTQPYFLYRCVAFIKTCSGGVDSHQFHFFLSASRAIPPHLPYTVAVKAVFVPTDCRESAG